MRPLPFQEYASHVVMNRHGVMVYDSQDAVEADQQEGLKDIENYTSRAGPALRERQLLVVQEERRNIVSEILDRNRELGLPTISSDNVIGVEGDEHERITDRLDRTLHIHDDVRKQLEGACIHPFVQTKKVEILASKYNMVTDGDAHATDLWRNKAYALPTIESAQIDVGPTYTAASWEGLERYYNRLRDEHGFTGVAVKHGYGVSGLGLIKLGKANDDHLKEEEESGTTWNDREWAERCQADFEALKHDPKLMTQLDRREAFVIDGWLGTATKSPKYRGTVLGAPSIGMYVPRRGEVYELGCTEQILEHSVHCANISANGQDWWPRAKQLMNQKGERIAQMAQEDGYSGLLSIDFIILQREDGSIDAFPKDPNPRWNGPAHGFLNRADVAHQLGKNPDDLDILVGNMKTRGPLEVSEVFDAIEREGLAYNISKLQRATRDQFQYQVCNVTDSKLQVALLGPKGSRDAMLEHYKSYVWEPSKPVSSLTS